MTVYVRHNLAALATYNLGIKRAVTTYQAETARAEQLATVQAANERQAQRRYRAKRKAAQ